MNTWPRCILGVFVLVELARWGLGRHENPFVPLRFVGNALRGKKCLTANEKLEFKRLFFLRGLGRWSGCGRCGDAGSSSTLAKVRDPGRKTCGNHASDVDFLRKGISEKRTEADDDGVAWGVILDISVVASSLLVC